MPRRSHIVLCFLVLLSIWGLYKREVITRHLCIMLIFQTCLLLHITYLIMHARMKIKKCSTKQKKYNIYWSMLQLILGSTIVGEWTNSTRTVIVPKEVKNTWNKDLNEKFITLQH